MPRDWGSVGGIGAGKVGRMDAGRLSVFGRCGGCFSIQVRPVKSAEMGRL
jgi:hypothetical protein